jgi:CubicO group peptidase (beta-lactamase class C family)
VIALVHNGRVFLDRAFSHADFVSRARLTPGHRFRAAAHSKTFSAAGILKLREDRKLSLDDRVGQYVDGLSRIARSRRRDSACTVSPRLLGARGCENLAG